MSFDFISHAFAADLEQQFSRVKIPGGTVSGGMEFVLNIILGIASALALLSLVIGAGQYLAAMGDPTKAESAKKTLTWTITGMVLLMLFYAIVNYIIPAVVKGR